MIASRRSCERRRNSNQKKSNAGSEIREAGSEARFVWEGEKVTAVFVWVVIHATVIIGLYVLLRSADWNNC